MLGSGWGTPSGDRDTSPGGHQAGTVPPTGTPSGTGTVSPTPGHRAAPPPATGVTARVTAGGASPWQPRCHGPPRAAGTPRGTGTGPPARGHGAGTVPPALGDTERGQGDRHGDTALRQCQCHQPRGHRAGTGAPTRDTERGQGQCHRHGTPRGDRDSATNPGTPRGDRDSATNPGTPRGDRGGATGTGTRRGDRATNPGGHHTGTVPLPVPPSPRHPHWDSASATSPGGHRAGPVPPARDTARGQGRGHRHGDTARGQSHQPWRTPHWDSAIASATKPETPALGQCQCHQPWGTPRWASATSPRGTPAAPRWDSAGATGTGTPQHRRWDNATSPRGHARCDTASATSPGGGSRGTRAVSPRLGSHRSEPSALASPSAAPWQGECHRGRWHRGVAGGFGCLQPLGSAHPPWEVLTSSKNLFVCFFF
ncbi:putative per-hexamer repeat protein 5 [Passer montanus]|uniref:putative per-hexamer repeat protein 5 n=1 Tax=Passer montanus TaxID=9160 RepID=UPI00195FBDED|nr:putative per-hexamer repeat protein 5 [Passer montanus]